MAAASRETLPLTVNYELAVEDGVRAGEYDYANPNITSPNFTTVREGEQKLEAVLVHFNRPISSEDALAELDAMGLRAGEAHEELAFGAKYPDKQRKFPIVALGSVWRYPGGDRDVLYLDEWGGKRGLYLGWFVDGWRERCRFLAFER